MAAELSSESEKLDSSKDLSQDSQANAVKRMLELADKRTVKLPPGEKVKDLIHEGHCY